MNQAAADPTAWEQGIGTASSAASIWPQLRLLELQTSDASSTKEEDALAEQKTIIQRALSSAEYPVTPGDVYQLVMAVPAVTSTSGSGATIRIPAIVKEDYSIDIPYVGLVSAKEMRFVDLRARVIEQIEKALPRSSQIDFTLASPAIFDVQVYGEAVHPGIVTVDPLEHVSDVIAYAKGVWLGASVRQIRLIRDGQSRTVDLFLYGFKGDTTQDPLVRPGDVVFVPRAQNTVVIGGAVMYPGTYEFAPGETLKMLVEYAGGSSHGDSVFSVDIYRYDPDGNVAEIEVMSAQDHDLALAIGDRIRVN